MIKRKISKISPKTDIETVQVIGETTEALKLSTTKNVDKESSLLEESLGCQTDVKKKLEDFEMLKVLGKGTFGKVRSILYTGSLRITSQKYVHYLGILQFLFLISKCSILCNRTIQTCTMYVVYM